MLSREEPDVNTVYLLIKMDFSAVLIYIYIVFDISKDVTSDQECGVK